MPHSSLQLHALPVLHPEPKELGSNNRVSIAMKKIYMVFTRYFVFSYTPGETAATFRKIEPRPGTYRQFVLGETGHLLFFFLFPSLSQRTGQFIAS